MSSRIETQVLIIGGGVTGTAVARELVRYKVDAVLIEKQIDVAGGQTKCNGGIVYSPVGLTWASSLIIKSVVDSRSSSLLHPESLKERLTLAGFNKFPQLVKELGLSSFGRNPTMAIATTEQDAKSLARIEEVCQQTGFEPERLSREAILAMEPNITGKVICGLYDRFSEALIYPWEYCIALMENARDNGVRVLTGAEVKAIQPHNGGFTVATSRDAINTEFIVNAAGAYADKVAEMAGVCDFSLQFFKGQTTILDRRLKGMIHCSLSSVPQPGRGGRVTPLPSGNLSTGFPEYFPTTDRSDCATERDWTEKSISFGRELVPGISEKDIIRSFTGMRVFNTRDPEDHIIEATKKHPHFINAVIRLPSLAASPAIAEYVVDLLGNQGLELVNNPHYNPYRKSIPQVSALSDGQRQNLLAQDARFGHIICRCEEVSEGEIVEAIKRGARTVSGVKYRTRAGMGRCQGGFCGPRVVEILARELDLPMDQITQNGGLSRVLLYRAKELLGQ